jgi:RHS repeat-associated protein
MTNANWVSGISGNALDLDGGDDEIIVSDSSSLSPSLPITMSAWVKPDTLSGNRGIISKWNTSWETMAYAMMILPNGALRGFFADGTNLAGKDSVGGVISTGSWYHIVAVMRGLNDVGLYVNGQEVSGTYGGNATSTYDNTAPMRMGAIAPGSGNNIDGKLDEVRIYNRTLSSQEILDLYNSPGASGSQNYTETYAYDAIGNITNKSDQGNYAYSQTGKANPHAVTSMGSANYTYDDNGNLLTVTGGLTNTWDYDNRITQSVVGATTVTYGYDASGQRVKYSTGAGTTVYVNKYYEISPDGKIKKYVYGGNEAVATLETQSGATTTYYTHKDHLGGSSVITNSSGSQVELLDYYPFGSTRLDEKSGSFETSHKYTGKELDADTGLYYYGARYYNASVGRFVSQDPAYLLIGDKERFKDKYDRTLSMHLSDPQSLNSYSYVNNNPLKYTDPDGEIVPLVALAAAYAAFEVSSTAYDGYVAVSTLLNKNASNTDKGLAVGAFGLGLGTVGPGNAYVKGAEEVANKAGNVIRMTSNQIGKEGERILGEIVGPGDVHKMFNTSQGKRFVDRFTGDVIHEVKNGYVSATKFVQKQISKDAEIIENNPGLQSTWHLLRGGSENVKNIIQSFGSKVVDYSKKLK